VGTGAEDGLTTDVEKVVRGEDGGYVGAVAAAVEDEGFLL
jgi:hypothetical protein